MLHDPKALKVAATFANTDVTRPALSGVCVEKSGRILASDGHKAIIIERISPQNIEEYPVGHNLTALTADTIIPVEAIKAATGSAIKMSKHIPILSQIVLGENGKPSLYRTNLDQSQVIPFRPIDSQFPALDQVIPTTPPAFTVSVNAELAATVLKALADLTKSDYTHTVAIEFRTDKTAIILRCEDNEHKAVAVLMPVRGKDQ